jgi:hypothetical protein
MLDGFIFEKGAKFDFSGLWDGRYVLQFTFYNDQQRQRTGLFYPGVELGDHADVIEVKNGGTPKRVVFRLPKDFGS